MKIWNAFRRVLPRERAPELGPSPVPRIAASLVLGLGASVLVLWLNGSPLLPAPREDSVSFLGAAESLVTGDGLRVPFGHWASPDSTQFLSHFPPGPSLAIAASMLAGIPSYGGALLLLALSAGALVGLVYWVGSELFGPFLAVLPVLAVVASEPLVRIHTAIWSEPPFLVLSLLLVWTMVRWPRRALVHGSLAAVSVLFRYVGLSGVLAAVLWAWAHGEDGWDRVRGALAAGLPGLGLFAAWSGVVRMRGESVRSLGFHPDAVGTLTNFAGELSRWLAPGLEGWRGGLMAAVVLSGALWLAVGAARRSGHAQVRMILRASALFAGLFAAVVLGARLFLDPLIPFDTRIFSPLVMLLAVAVGLGLSDGWKRWSRVPAAAGIAALAAWAGSSAYYVGQAITEIQRAGRFYTSTVWITSEPVRWVDNAGRDWRIYSNEPQLFWVLSGRTGWQLPGLGEPGAGQAFREVFRQRPGAVVVTSPLGAHDLSPDSLARLLDLDVAVTSVEGVVLLPRAREGASP